MWSRSRSESDILAGVGVGVLFLRADSDSFNFDLTQIKFLFKAVIFFHDLKKNMQEFHSFNSNNI